MVLEKIIERYQTESEENLQIREDMLKVLPHIQYIIQDAEHYKINDELAKDILVKTDQLDDIAYDVNLLKSDEEYLEGVDEKAILKLFDGISYNYRCKGENMCGVPVAIKVLPSNQKPKIHQNELNMIREFYALKQLVKEHKRKWLTIDTFEGFNFGVAINVAGSILNNAQFNIENVHFSIKRTCNVIKLVVLPKQENQTLQKSEFSVQVFPKLAKLIKNILDITKDTSITEERKNQVEDNMMDLIDFAYEIDLEGIKKLRQYNPDGSIKLQHEIDLECIKKFRPSTDPDVTKRQNDEIMGQLHNLVPVLKI